MPESRGTLGSPRLRRLTERGVSPASPPTAEEHCELCGRPVPPEHRHVIDTRSRELLCTCPACSLLFDRPAAAEGHLRLVGDRRLVLRDFALDDIAWATLAIPVDMAFFFHSSETGRTRAFYPGPMGATESRLELATWESVIAANPILATLQPDVEALLVNRARGARRYWIVPVDDAYRLVAVIRMRWRGFTGGKEVWAEIERFFADLDRRARPVRAPQPVPSPTP